MLKPIYSKQYQRFLTAEFTVSGFVYLISVPGNLHLDIDQKFAKRHIFSFKAIVLSIKLIVQVLGYVNCDC